MFQKENVSHIKKMLIKQLYKDYENILYIYDVKLKTPIITLVEVSSYYGSWCSKTRTISLSFSLFHQSSWADILEVLKHEIAHQYVEEIFNVSDSHGPFFQKACKSLRVALWARKSCLKLDKKLNKENFSDESKKESQPLRLVRKLLQLSRSSNRHEAFLALQKASEIAQKYQIEQGELEPEEGFSSLIIEIPRKRIHSYESHIVQIVIDFFGVKVIYSNLFNLERLREEKTLEFFGTEQNIKMAEYVYLFLTRTVCVFWKEHQLQTQQKGLKCKNQFMFGVLMGLENHLKLSQREWRKQNKSVEVTLPALVEKNLQKFVYYHHPKLKESLTRQTVWLSKAYHDGFAKGVKIRIRTPLESKAKKFIS